MSPSNIFMFCRSQSSVDVIEPNVQTSRTPAMAPAGGQSSDSKLSAVRFPSPTADALLRRLSHNRENSLQDHSTSPPASPPLDPEVLAKALRRQELRSNYDVTHPYSIYIQSIDEPNSEQKEIEFLESKGLAFGKDYLFATAAGEDSTRDVVLSDSGIQKLKGSDEVMIFPSKVGLYVDGQYAEYEARLKQDAKTYLTAHNSFPPRPIPELAKDASHQTVIKTVLEEYEGIVIGEFHSDASSKQFVIDNLQTLKNSGVQTLFLEHVLSDDHQDDLDQYLGSAPGSAMPDKLHQYLEKQKNGHGCWDKQYNFLTLVEAVKEAGLKIVPIDCRVSYGVYSGTDDDSEAAKEESKTRLEVMNYLAAEKIKNRENDGKWIAFVGNAHVNTNKGVPGVAELTGTLSVALSDKKENPSNPPVRTNVENYFGDQFSGAINRVDIAIEPE
ncbi:membrane-targeted effector domain-containing toxin [Undibacterium sp. SXout7W]|uniref:membrane-targeted effector domain-containing toxin n=1 Tax=Undibacterium sp. SXout7W TaxID=3413049 RepID=UPI003BF00B4A